MSYYACAVPYLVVEMSREWSQEAAWKLSAVMTIIIGARNRGERCGARSLSHNDADKTIGGAFLSEWGCGGRVSLKAVGGVPFTEEFHSYTLLCV